LLFAGRFDPFRGAFIPGIAGIAGIAGKLGIAGMTSATAGGDNPNDHIRITRRPKIIAPIIMKPEYCFRDSEIIEVRYS